MSEKVFANKEKVCFKFFSENLNKMSEKVSANVKSKTSWWPKQDLNLHYNDYESSALTN